MISISYCYLYQTLRIWNGFIVLVFCHYSFLGFLRTFSFVFCFSTLLAFCIIWWCFLHFSFHVLIRSQKEEALHFRLAKCNEVCQLEKVYCLKTASIKPRSESIILSTNKFDKEIFYFFFIPLGALKLFHHYLIIFVYLFYPVCQIQPSFSWMVVVWSFTPVLLKDICSDAKKKGKFLVMILQILCSWIITKNWKFDVLMGNWIQLRRCTLCFYFFYNSILVDRKPFFSLLMVSESIDHISLHFSRI